MRPNKSHQVGNKITGLVLDSYGEPIIGASVSLEGTGTGTITGLDGEFELMDVPQNVRLPISYIGYLSQTVSVAGKRVLNITLMEDVQKLEEVVVIGYGTQKKKEPDPIRCFYFCTGSGKYSNNKPFQCNGGTYAWCICQ